VTDGTALPEGVGRTGPAGTGDVSGIAPEEVGLEDPLLAEGLCAVDDPVGFVVEREEEELATSPCRGPLGGAISRTNVIVVAAPTEATAADVQRTQPPVSRRAPSCAPDLES
jgi:hypothetical protein